MGRTSIQYTNKDYESIRRELLAKIPHLTDRWTDFNHSDLGVVLVELFCGIGDMLAYYLDVQAAEAFLPTARQRQNVNDLCKLIGYRLDTPVAATTTLRFGLSGPLGTDLIVPAGTVCRALLDNGKADFETAEDGLIPRGVLAVNVPARQGVRRTETFTGMGQPFQRFRLTGEAIAQGSKLPGLVFSLGAFRMLCKNQTNGLRKALVFHHPAGTRCFFLQMLDEYIEGCAGLRFDHADAIRRTALTFMDEAFVLGRTSLGSCRHLTNKQRVQEFMQLTSTVEMLPEIEESVVNVARFPGRQERMRLNRRVLNDRRLPNTGVRKERVSFCTPIYTGRDYQQEVLQSRFGLGNDRLNRRALPTAGAVLTQWPV